MDLNETAEDRKQNGKCDSSSECLLVRRGWVVNERRQNEMNKTETIQSNQIHSVRFAHISNQKRQEPRVAYFCFMISYGIAFFSSCFWSKIKNL